MGGISSGIIDSVDEYPVHSLVEGVECEVVLSAERPASSELKAQAETVCVADSFRDSNVPAQGLCSSVAASKSNSSKIFPFKGCSPGSPKATCRNFFY